MGITHAETISGKKYCGVFMKFVKDEMNIWLENVIEVNHFQSKNKRENNRNFGDKMKDKPDNDNRTWLTISERDKYNNLHNIGIRNRTSDKDSHLQSNSEENERMNSIHSRNIYNDGENQNEWNERTIANDRIEEKNQNEWNERTIPKERREIIPYMKFSLLNLVYLSIDSIEIKVSEINEQFEDIFIISNNERIANPILNEKDLNKRYEFLDFDEFDDQIDSFTTENVKEENCGSFYDDRSITLKSTETLSKKGRKTLSRTKALDNKEHRSEEPQAKEIRNNPQSKEIRNNLQSKECKTQPIHSTNTLLQKNKPTNNNHSQPVHKTVDNNPKQKHKKKNSTVKNDKKKGKKVVEKELEEHKTPQKTKDDFFDQFK